MVYALFLLGGDAKRIHTEDIALKAFELFPHSFSWAKHTKYPDKDIVRVALTDSRKEQYGALVEGRSGQTKGQTSRTKRLPSKDGWILTERGVAWVSDNIRQLSEAFESVTSQRQQVLIRLKRLRQHRIFLVYLDEGESFSPSIGDLADFLQCRVDASPEIWDKRFSNLLNLVLTAHQPDFRDFLEICRDAYTEQR